jgi:hypothetical protein
LTPGGASPHCHQCGAEVVLNEPLARDAECGACGGDLRCCLNCRHYDTHFNNACRETEAEPVVDKHRRNFCEFFVYSREPFKKAGAGRESAAREKLGELFGGKNAGESRADEARRKLDQLFKPKGD